MSTRQLRSAAKKSRAEEEEPARERCGLLNWQGGEQQGKTEETGTEEEEEELEQLRDISSEPVLAY